MVRMAVTRSYNRCGVDFDASGQPAGLWARVPVDCAEQCSSEAEVCPPAFVLPQGLLSQCMVDDW
jgi:hypothetical protein